MWGRSLQDLRLELFEVLSHDVQRGDQLHPLLTGGVLPGYRSQLAEAFVDRPP
jgi:hypothetical protein